MADETLKIRDATDLGTFVRAVRKAQGLRQDEVGRLSHTFIGDLEEGKPTAQLGKVLEVLSELGVSIHVAPPPGMEWKQIERYLRDVRTRDSKDDAP
jgi:transcriptional regulator with XRE-family HTH domain